MKPRYLFAMVCIVFFITLPVVVDLWSKDASSDVNVTIHTGRSGEGAILLLRMELPPDSTAIDAPEGPAGALDLTGADVTAPATWDPSQPSMLTLPEASPEGVCGLLFSFGEAGVIARTGEVGNWAPIGTTLDYRYSDNTLISFRFPQSAVVSGVSWGMFVQLAVAPQMPVNPPPGAFIEVLTVPCGG